ncbi:acyl-coenzyme A thioesterase 11b isoform 2-T2 [Anableps anableps]
MCSNKTSAGSHRTSAEYFTSIMTSEEKDADIMLDPHLIQESREVYRNPTEVQMSQIVLPCHANHCGELSVGQLLKWMDSTACLSAERHAGCSCVTASVDDIHFEHTIGVGQVVSIIAKVNRAFTSSMEVGILVTCEDLYSDKQWKVCHAFATFVSRRTETGKVQLKQVIPHTQMEHMEYSLAAERRRMRLIHAEIITDLLSSSTAQLGECQEYDDAVPSEKTRVESVELVLPPHANHQVSTFGGQIMAWMENVATIAASRLCNAHPTLRTIDMFHFRGPSHIGDRLVLKAIVNNAFKHSMEVGVCAEAYQGGEPLRHINSAFMTFEVLDSDRKPRTLPHLRPEPVDGRRRYKEAIARKKIRLDRECEVISHADEDDTLYRVVTPSVSKGGKGKDFILLASRRKPCDSRDPYLIALRSVTLPNHPPTEDFSRGEVLCAGFTIWEESSAVTKFTYYNQATPGVLPYISTDVAGLSSSFYSMFSACSQFLEANKHSLSALPSSSF